MYKEETTSIWYIMKLVLLCLIPPIGVFFKAGIYNKHFWINLVLTFVGYLPGLVHGIWGLH